MKWLFSSEGRRAGAFLALLGGATVFTIYASVVLYLVKGAIGLVFWLGIAAHLQIALITSGLVALFVKRSLAISKDGITVNDATIETPAVTTTTTTSLLTKDTSVPPAG